MRPNVRSVTAWCGDRILRLASRLPATATGVAHPDFHFRSR